MSLREFRLEQRIDSGTDFGDRRVDGVFLTDRIGDG